MDTVKSINEKHGNNQITSLQVYINIYYILIKYVIVFIGKKYFQQ